MLEVKSSTKGMLVPRMTTTQRVAIGAPAEGLFVYDTTTHTFWYRNNTLWINIAPPAGQPPAISDASSGAMSRTLKEQQALIENQKSRIATLEELNASMQTDLKTLQTQVAGLIKSNEGKPLNP